MAEATINTDTQLVVPTKLTVGDLLVSADCDGSVVLVTYVSSHCNNEAQGILVLPGGSVEVQQISLSHPKHLWRVPNTGTSITFTQE